MLDADAESKFDPKAFPIVYIQWRDHTVSAPVDGAWIELKDALKETGFIVVHEVGFLLKNTDTEIVIAACLSEDEGTKGLSTILPECVISMTQFKAEEQDGWS